MLAVCWSTDAAILGSFFDWLPHVAAWNALHPWPIASCLLWTAVSSAANAHLRAALFIRRVCCRIYRALMRPRRQHPQDSPCQPRVCLSFSPFLLCSLSLD